MISRKVIKKKKRELSLLPDKLIKLYSFIAVIIVLIPEWLAELGISLLYINSDNKLIFSEEVFKKTPELRVSSLTLFELRELAMKSGLKGYSRECKEVLSKRLIRKLYQASQKTGKDPDNKFD